MIIKFDGKERERISKREQYMLLALEHGYLRLCVDSKIYWCASPYEKREPILEGFFKDIIICHEYYYSVKKLIDEYCKEM